MPLFITLGLAGARSAEISRATWYYSTAIQLSPTYAGAYVHQGLVLLRQGQAATASRDFAKSMALDKQMKAYIEALLAKK